MDQSTLIQNIPLRTKIYAFLFAFLILLADGADVIFLSFSYTSIANDFSLTQTQIGSLGTLSLIGMGIGGAFGGWACDRFGRVNTIVWSVILFSIGTASLGFTNDYYSFAIIRFVSSLGMGSVFLGANTLMSEYIGSQYRTTILSILQAGWTVGYVVATLLAGWIIPDYGWRPLFFIAIIPVFFAVIMKQLVPETPIWLAQKANAVEQKSLDTQESPYQPKSKMKLIFENKSILRTFLAWIAMAAFFQFGYYGANNWLPSYLELELGLSFKTMAGYMVGTYIAMIAGKVVAGILADRIGRRPVYSLSALAIAAFIPVIIFWHTSENIVYLMILFGFLYGLPTGVLGTYMTESFPVSVRGSATGWAYNVGRFGAALAPITIGFLSTSLGIGMSFLTLGFAYLMTGLIALIFVKSRLYDTDKE